MRTIKFRGKSTTSKKWRYGVPLKIDDGTVIIEEEGVFNDGSASPFFSKWDFIYPDTVGQFTGIENESIELYEHDLVECCGVLCEVVYNDKIGTFVLLEVLTQNLGNKPIGQMIDMFGIKHIGNIYDNTELLK